jgi:hypothetical protein
MRTVDQDTVAKAMVRDAEQFIDGSDREAMGRKLGWRGLKRLYYDDFVRLAADFDASGDSNKK